MLARVVRHPPRRRVGHILALALSGALGGVDRVGAQRTLCAIGVRVEALWLPLRVGLLDVATQGADVELGVVELLLQHFRCDVEWEL